MTDQNELLKELSKAAGFQTSSVRANDAMITRRDSEDWHFSDRDPSKDPAVFINALAALLVNVDLTEDKLGNGSRALSWLLDEVARLVGQLDQTIQSHLDQIMKQPRFRIMEQNFRALGELIDEADTDDVRIDLLDVTKEELGDDLRDNSGDILGSALFKKMYVDEFDRYGGEPFGAMIALYDFNPADPGDDRDLEFLKAVGKVASHCHAPFIAAVKPAFFDCASFAEIGTIGGIDELLQRPRYGKWEAFRNEHEAAYIGLTLPGYLLRSPWDLSGSARLDFRETVRNVDEYLWGNSAALFARNMIRSFEVAGWCQHVAGPLGGGLVEGLSVHSFEKHGRIETQPPVQAAIPDYRELQLAKAGFLPLVHKKGTADVAFFSAQSIKKPRTFVDELDTQNAHLVCNLAYTLSITRIAHYVKRMVRDYIGSTADAPYIQNMLDQWLSEYVTSITNPDDLTLRQYPFKAVSVTVEPKVGPLGWYKCTVSVLPHVQFQGMDVELRLEASLGGA